MKYLMFSNINELNQWVTIWDFYVLHKSTFTSQNQSLFICHKTIKIRVYRWIYIFICVSKIERRPTGNHRNEKSYKHIDQIFPPTLYIFKLKPRIYKTKILVKYTRLSPIQIIKQTNNTERVLSILLILFGFFLPTTFFVILN